MLFVLMQDKANQSFSCIFRCLFRCGGTHGKNEENKGFALEPIENIRKTCIWQQFHVDFWGPFFGRVFDTIFEIQSLDFLFRSFLIAFWTVLMLKWGKPHKAEAHFILLLRFPLANRNCPSTALENFVWFNTVLRHSARTPSRTQLSPAWP